MPERYEIVAKVISQKGHCAQQHKVGDEWVIGSKTPAGVCVVAFNAILPKVRALMFGGALPFGPDPYVTTAACPDGDNPVIFELRRLQK